MGPLLVLNKRDINMEIKSVSIDNLLFRRPGITKILYTADYGTVKRRGVIMYDVVAKKFLTNTSEIKLLSAVCLLLRRPDYISLADQ